jgi:hypothetical protein
LLGPWTFDVDVPSVYDVAKGKGFEDNLGEILYSHYLGYLADSLEKLVKDDMVKQAIVDASTKKVVALKFVDKTETYNDVVFDEGRVVIQTKPNNLATNVYQIGEDIIGRL